jgi:hypothetical protein
MSRFPPNGTASSSRAKWKDRDLQGKSLRFTPLRSHILRARDISEDGRSELALSRLIPAAPLET